MIKEKLAGFKYLFADKEIRGSAIITFLLAGLLVSVEYLYGHVPDGIVLAIAICAYVEFQYLFVFLVMFNVWRLFGAFRDKRDARKKRRALWAARIVSLLSVALGTTLLVYLLLPFNLLLLAVSFISWCVMETYFMCKLATELTGDRTRKGIRFLVYLLVVVAFGLYLTVSFWAAVKSGPVPPEGSLFFGIDATALDWGLTLFLFVFSIATMGYRFMSRSGPKALDFDRMPGKEAAKIRNGLVFMFFSLIGFEIFVRGFNLLSPLTPVAAFGLYIYYGVKLFLFVPFAVGFGIAVLAGKRKP
ncbi:MAG: hypothetical protein JW839_11250 [Candidatus Lokiarchaeota archaeon]|nr:hypothetical protein [Candidatus Lokiarchaeota archaeon]